MLISGLLALKDKIKELILIKKFIFNSNVLFYFLYFHVAVANIDQGKEAYFVGEYERALELLLPEANNGSSYAQIKMGFMHENGWGTERSFNEALNWYEKAATADDPEGHISLAKLYAYGRGVVKDYNTAEEHILKAVKLGHPHAYYVLGDFHNDNEAFGFNESYALRYYLLAAAQNAAATSVNGHFRKGSGTWFRLITPKGVQTTRRAADDGNVYAQFNVGLRYYFGEGVGKNHNVANSYFLMAAHSGNAQAQNYLAQNRVLQNPDDFDKIFVTKWFSVAAENGNKQAKINKENLESTMSDREIKQAEEATRAWLDR